MSALLVVFAVLSMDEGSFARCPVKRFQSKCLGFGLVRSVLRRTVLPFLPRPWGLQVLPWLACVGVWILSMDGWS